MHQSSRSLFLQHVAQTSPTPLALEITSAKGTYLFDKNGKQYLDLISGISVSNLGHCHPDVVKAVQDQAEKFMHLMVYGEYVHTPQVILCKALSDILPSNLNSTYLVNSGAEATEGAIKLAKRYTGKTKIICFENAYHGSTHGALSVMGNEEYKNSYRPLLPGVSILKFNSIQDLSRIDNQTAAVIIEPVQGESGINKASQEFLVALRQRCDQTQTLLIFDEIQSGFGRTGSFFAFEQYNVAPDILLLAKGMGGGMPIGAFISSTEIMNSLTHNPVLGHITTFGGNAVCAAASLATLNIIRDKQLYKRAFEIEEFFRDNLKHSAIKEIRSSGALIAVEFGDTDINMAIIAKCIEKGIITDWFLFCTTAMRIAPPLIIEEADLKLACEKIIEAINETV